MKTEKIVISFIASLIGIIAAAGAFYFYQTTKVISPNDIKTITLSPTPEPSPKPSIFLTLDAPTNEEVTDKKIISVNGTTNPDAVVIITSGVGEQVISPSTNGSFATTITLDNGQNQITVTVVSPIGEETTLTRTVTVSSETF